MVQDNELSLPKEKSSRLNLLWLVKLVITVLILSYIFKTFRTEQKGIGDISLAFAGIFEGSNLLLFGIIFLLVPLNWALESLKWQKLAQKLFPITFSEAFRGILTGLAVGVAAPAQLGDTIGRIAALKTDRRLEAIGAALISNGIQFMVSVAGGAIGWFYLKDNLELPLLTKNAVSVLLVAILVLSVPATLLRTKLNNWQPRRKIFQKFQQYFFVIARYTGNELLIASLFGGSRYLVFLSQFILVLVLFKIPLGVPELAGCVSLIFLAKTLVPAINVLGDLGLREFTALVVFSSYQLPPEQIIAATFLVWIVNVLGPILIGIFLIWKYKWKQPARN